MEVWSLLKGTDYGCNSVTLPGLYARVNSVGPLKPLVAALCLDLAIAHANGGYRPACQNVISTVMSIPGEGPY